MNTRCWRWRPVWVVLALGTGLAPPVRGEQVSPVEFDWTGPKKEGDEAEVRFADGVVTIDVRSKTGIGRATLRRTGDVWPRVVLRLNLAGLEGFHAVSDKAKWEYFLSPEENYRRVRLRMDGQPVGPIDVELPLSFRKSAKDEIQIQWVDFYRL